MVLKNCFWSSGENLKYKYFLYRGLGGKVMVYEVRYWRDNTDRKSPKIGGKFAVMPAKFLKLYDTLSTIRRCSLNEADIKRIVYMLNGVC